MCLDYILEFWRISAWESVLKRATFIFRDSIQSEQIAQASSMAWAREKALVSADFRGQDDWTNSQRAELASSSRGKVKGFTAAEIHGRNR